MRAPGLHDSAARSGLDVRHVPRPTQGGGTITRWLDRAAISLSGLCLVHCLAFPLIILALPATGEFLPRQWWVHPVIFAGAVPLALLALIRGFLGHRDRRPLVLGGIGLGTLGLGLLSGEGSVAEIILTVLGGSVVAIAHVLNWHQGTHAHT